MADSNQRPSAPDDEPSVGGALDAYRSRREEVRATMRDVTRLREELRRAAEDEASEIVDLARRDVRQTLVGARQNLLVLAAQVQAALDAGEKPSDGGRRRSRLIEDMTRADPRADMGELAATRDLLAEARQNIRQIMRQARPAAHEVHRDTEQSDARSDAMAAAEADDRDEVWLHSARPLQMAMPVAAMPGSGVPEWLDSRRTAAFALVATLLVVLIGTIWWSRDATVSPEDPGLAATPASTGSVAGPSETTGRAAAEEAAAALPPPAPPALALEAYRDVWVQLTVDGHRELARTLAPGDGRNITGARTILIRAGDAGALWISVNGSPLEPMGEDGQVLTRSFTLQDPSRE